MSGKLFVHIGLPKTATTTLQTVVFPTVAVDEIRYLGVFQPRKAITQNELYLQFCKTVETGADAQKLHLTMEDILSTGTTLVLSEEMCCVSSKGAPWRTKLSRISQLVHGLDYSIILTVREPISAMFSYYTELHDRFDRTGEKFIDLARHAEVMQIFHYKKLTDALFSTFDSSRLFVLSFEDIVLGHNEGLCRWITQGHKGWIGGVPRIHNAKTRSKYSVRTGRSVTLADGPRRLVRKLGRRETRTIQLMRKLSSQLLREMDRVRLFEKRIVMPSEMTLRQLRHDLADETAALENHFGIKY